MTARRLLPTALVLAVTAAAPDVARSADPPARPARKVALLVGVSEYLHDFERLSYTQNDVNALAEVLRDGGFDEVVVLSDPPEGKNPATRKNVLDRLTKLVGGQTDPAKNVRRGDVVLVVLSGHGQELPVDGKAEAFFAPVDGRKGRAATLIGIGQLVNEVLAPCGGRNLLLVDACRDEYDPDKGRGVGGGSVALTGQVAVLFSCSSRERSWESNKMFEEAKRKEGKGHGVFTHAVLEVVRDAEQAGKPLTWSGLVSRVEEKMGEEAVRKLIPDGQTQTPVQAAGQVPATTLFAARPRGPVDPAVAARVAEAERQLRMLSLVPPDRPAPPKQVTINVQTQGYADSKLAAKHPDFKVIKKGTVAAVVGADDKTAMYHLGFPGGGRAWVPQDACTPSE